jgi:hypothetical protein
MKTRPQCWYAAVLIVECRVGGDDKRRLLFDRQLRLICAADHEEAYCKALKLGRAENQSYQNPRGEVVQWRFIGLENLAELLTDTIEDGVEIYSSLQRGDPRKKLSRKKNLSVFYYEANKQKKVGELLAPRLRRYVPIVGGSKRKRRE